MSGGYASRRYDEDKINYIIITTGYEAKLYDRTQTLHDIEIIC